MPVLPSKHKKLVAAVTGVVLVGAPVLAFNHWSGEYIDQLGREQVALAAQRSIVLAEHRINQVVGGLDDLARRGMVPCSTAFRDAMHATALATTPVKELSVLSPDGETLCSSLGIPHSVRVLSRPTVRAAPAVIIEVVGVVGRTDRMVRVRRVAADGGPTLAALVPADLMVPQVASRLGPYKTYARVSTRDGTLIGESGSVLEDEEDPADRIALHRQSELYGLDATASMSRAVLTTGFFGFRLLGVAGGVGVLLLGMAAIALRRSRENPIAEIERALEADEFVPYYQPILDITTGQLAGAEVLVRWRKSDGTVVAPGNFIPLVESTGLIFDLTRALMRRVCAEAGAAIGARPRLRIGFNLTAKHFADDSTIDDMRSIFASAPISLSQVVLEVTERQPLANLNAARRVIAGLQELGVRVAIDDVGTGHGGLSYLLKLGVDIIKIDKLFVDAIGAERYSTTIIKSLVDLAQSMRMEIVAEGVENFDQVAYLRDHGIRYAQGYVFAPALPGPAFLDLLEATDPIRIGLADTAEENGIITMPHYISARTRVAAA